ncbi:hypothetical protein ACROYT_G015935 [Oculina patagonica]
MADEEDSAELIQTYPKDHVSDSRSSSSESLVQAISRFFRAFTSDFVSFLPNHRTAQSKTDKAAAPVGQSAEHPTGEPMDQTVRAHKRQLPIDIIVVDENNPTRHPRIEDVSDDGDLDGLLSANSRWEPSEELDALLNVIQKPLQRFKRRSTIKEFPRPSSEAAFTPNLDNYLISMIPGVKISDNSLRNIKDKTLDVPVPLCTLYENFTMMYESLDEGAITVEKSAVMGMFNCVKKAVMLVGDTSAQMSAKHREQVLTKLNPVLSSLGKEDFPDAGKQLFGDGIHSSSRTDIECQWKKRKSTSSLSLITPNASDRSALYEDLKEYGRFTGLCWLMSPEPQPQAKLPIPTIEEIIFSEEFMKTRGSQQQLDCLVRNAKVQEHDVILVSKITVGQRDNPAWHLARKVRLTASNFGSVLQAKRVTPSLLKRLLGEYDLT